MNPPMTVKDLFEILRFYPLDMPVRLVVYGHQAGARKVNCMNSKDLNHSPDEGRVSVVIHADR